jgi:lysophospholipase L1-like esterase
MSRRLLFPAPLFISLALLFAAAAPGATAAADSTLPAPLARAQRIVFLGDSITYAGTYVDFVEAVLRTAHPAWRAELLDLGLPSETTSGLSEPGHAGGRFPRPDLHERLDRVLAQTRPNLVIACYGMNDGIYHPFSEERFAAFREGQQWLHDKVTAAGAAILHLTPPIFDPEPIREKVLPAGRDEYPRAFAGYDAVLARYAEWLLAQRARGWSVIDLHGPMAAELAARREAASGFAFSKDGIHPDKLGHAVLARALLAAWQVPPEQAGAPLAWAAAPESELLRLIRTRRKLLSDAWLTATKHQRPGMTPGRPLAEAETEAAALAEKIRALAAAR